jgi:hypothetical protein
MKRVAEGFSISRELLVAGRPEGRPLAVHFRFSDRCGSCPRMRLTLVGSIGGWMPASWYIVRMNIVAFLGRVTEFYVDSEGFNGLPAPSAGLHMGELRQLIRPLVESGQLYVNYEDY